MLSPPRQRVKTISSSLQKTILGPMLVDRSDLSQQLTRDACPETTSGHSLTRLFVKPRPRVSRQESAKKGESSTRVYALMSLGEQSADDRRTSASPDWATTAVSRVRDKRDPISHIAPCDLLRAGARARAQSPQRAKKPKPLIARAPTPDALQRHRAQIINSSDSINVLYKLKLKLKRKLAADVKDECASFYSTTLYSAALNIHLPIVRSGNAKHDPPQDRTRKVLRSNGPLNSLLTANNIYALANLHDSQCSDTDQGRTRTDKAPIPRTRAAGPGPAKRQPQS
ncbi:hypothetical protein DENSPDRAFT_853976 [Dentipellis sp. KUC8613]|nr:hypothetical protein DENSPDRAFT_853976 [Dentipellis sp. KUC8613]